MLLGIEWFNIVKYRDYFGDNGKFNLTWLLPINPRYKDLEGVRGYCIRSLDV